MTVKTTGIARNIFCCTGSALLGVIHYNRQLVGMETIRTALAMGAEGIVVDDIEQVGAALKKAIDLQMNQRKTCVIEIMCTRELGDPFRRDALAKPVRFLEKYTDYV